MFHLHHLLRFCWHGFAYLVCFLFSLAGLFGANSAAEWDPFRLRVQLSEAAAALFQESGTLPQGLAANGLQTGLPQLDSLNRAHGATQVRRVFQSRPGFEERHRQFGLDRWIEITFAEPRPILALQSDYLASAGVVWAEPIYQKISLDEAAFPNDPRFAEQWALRNTGQGGGTPGADISMEQAWQLSTGDPSVVVLIVDSGIAVAHPDLVDSLWINPNPGPENGYDGDVNGWNFVDGNADLFDSSGHGTQVAGIIGASTNNTIGIAGVAGGMGSGDGVRLMIARTFNSIGAGGFAEALVYGADNGAVIASNSWGYTVPDVFEEVVLDAIDYFIANAGRDADGALIGPVDGGVVVFAAGNSGSNERFYPAAYPPVVAVASTNRNDLKASSATYGEWIDLSAPGASILTTHRNGSYTTVSGSSFACPHVSGVAALLASRFPGISNLQLIDRLLSTTDSIDALNPDFTGLLGSGRLNAAQALDDDPNQPPAAIDDLELITTNQAEVTLQWTAPGASGNSGQAESYELRYAMSPINEDNFAMATPAESLQSPSPAGALESFTVVGLASATEYWFAIRSRDFFGNQSELSNVVTAATWALPQASISPSSISESMETGALLTRELTLANAGEGPLVFSIDSDSLPAWLTVEPGSGIVEGGETELLLASINAGGLANGIYEAVVTVLTNDPLVPELTVALELTITGGVAAMTVEPLMVDFGNVFIGFPVSRTVTIANPGTDALTLTSLDLSGNGFTMDASAPLTIPAGDELALLITFIAAVAGDETGSLHLTGDVPESEPIEVSLNATALQPPIANITPLSIERTLPFDSVETVTVTIANDGGEDLIYSVRLLPTASSNPAPEPLIAINGLNATSSPSPEQALEERIHPVDFIHDDGSAEDSIGLTSGGEFFWFNQFTPAENDYPFVLTQAAVFFPDGSDIATGKTFDLYVYAADAGEPGETATLLQRVAGAAISTEEDWTYVPLSTPLYITEPTNLLIGVVNREAGLNSFPAAIDLDGGSRERSWIGTYEGGVPEEPGFPADGLWGLVDDFGFAGNWLIRGFGHRDFVRLDRDNGIVAGGNFDSFNVTIEPKDLLAGSYYYLLEIETNDPAQALLTIPLTITVTGDPRLTVAPDALDFGSIMVETEKTLSLLLRNDGIDTLEIFDATTSDLAFSLDFVPFTLAPGKQRIIEVNFAPMETGAFVGDLSLFSNDPNEPERLIALSGESIPPPEVRVDPKFFNIELTRLETLDLMAMLYNDGEGPLFFNIRRGGVLFPDGVATLPIQNAGLPPVEFIIDDGSAEDSLGFSDGLQFLWANQFTPEAGDVPLFLERVEVFFDQWTQAEVGDPLDLHIYHVTDSDPANGATLIHSILDQTVQSLEGWSVYELEAPLLLDEAGDILVGVVFRAPLFTGWPATIDTASPRQQRSWIGVYMGDPPTHPQLPATDYWGLVDDLGFGGNWMIRAHGTRAFSSVDSDQGTIAAGESMPLAIKVSGLGLSPGDYGVDVIINSNDPIRPELILPISLSVSGAQSLSISPALLDFGPVREDRSAQLLIELSNTGADPLMIESLELDHPALSLDGIELPLLLDPQQSVLATLTLDHDLIESIETELTVVSDDPKQPVQVIPITAEIVAAPKLSWDAEVMTTIEGLAGANDVLSFEVSNTGGSPLHYHLRAAASAEADDAFGYLWRCNQMEPNLPYRWLDAREHGVELTELTGTPDGNQLVTLPFGFNFYGERVDKARVSVNGWLTFGDFSGGGWTPRELPDAREPRHIVAPFWDDLSLLDGGRVHVLHVNEDDDEYWIVQWSEVQRMAEPNAELTFQAVFWPSGLIEFRYQSMVNSGANASIGIADANGERGLQVAYASAFAEDGKVVRILAETVLVPNLPIEGTIPAGETATVSIPYAAEGLFTGVYLQDLVLGFDDTDLTTVWLPLKLTLSGEPSIAIQPGLLDFGAVAVGSVTVQNLMVSNTGTDTLTLSDLVLSHPSFSAPIDLPVSIPAGTTFDLAVELLSQAEGEYSGQLLIHSNAVNSPERTVFLRANSIYETSVPTASRSLPDWYMPGKALSETHLKSVQLMINPDESTVAYAVEDMPPEGWIVDPESISDGGSVDPLNGKVKFGPFFDNQPRTLSYDVTPPLEASGEAIFAGVVAVDGLTRPIEGKGSTFFDTRHPADDSPEGFVMTASAVTAYGAAWKLHQSWPRPPEVIPISYVTRAGALWRQGEIYQFDTSAGTAPMWWISATESQPLVGLLGLTSASAIASGPSHYYPGEPLDFSIAIEPQNGVLSYALEEKIPAGWVVPADTISHGGSFHSASSTLRFGPFLDNEPRTFSFVLLPPDEARGGVNLSGTLSYNGLTAATQGRRLLQAPPASYAEWVQRMGLSSAAAQPDADPEAVGISNLLRYSLGLDLDGAPRDNLPQMRVFSVADDDLMRPGLRFLLSTSADDIQLHVEVSSDLINWLPIPDSSLQWHIGPPEQGLREVEIYDLEAIPGNPPRRFYRLRVKLAE